MTDAPFVMPWIVELYCIVLYECIVCACVGSCIKHVLGRSRLYKRLR